MPGRAFAHGNIGLDSEAVLALLLFLFSAYAVCLVAPLFADSGPLAVRIAKGLGMAFIDAAVVLGVAYLASRLWPGVPGWLAGAWLAFVPWVWPIVYLFRNRGQVLRTSRRLSEAAERDVRRS